VALVGLSDGGIVVCCLGALKTSPMKEKIALWQVCSVVVLLMGEGCLDPCHHCLRVWVCVGSSGDVQISDHSV
jgi:hypothetical protein